MEKSKKSRHVRLNAVFFSDAMAGLLARNIFSPASSGASRSRFGPRAGC